MKMIKQGSGLRLTVVASALMATFSVAQAEDDEIARLSRPESAIRLGAGYVDRDNQRYGQYSGLQEAGVYGLADVDLVQRNDATGTWLKLRGRNLGLDSRELRLDHLRQGDWGYFVEYSETPRFTPYVINTGLQGIGSNSLTVSTAGKRNVTLDTKRGKTSLGLDKRFAGDFAVQLRVSSEEKDGARLYGRGNTSATSGSAGTFNFLAEPISNRIDQFEATLGYTGDRLQLSGGYYGSFFTNHYASLSIVGGGAGLNGAGAATQSPIALPPGNEAHQLYLAGGYDFSRTTRSTFKLAYSIATQNDAFIGNPPGVANTATTGNISGRTDAGGRVDTTLLQWGLTARPMTSLSLNANLRFEDRDDRTAVARYISLPAPATTTPPGAQFSTHDGRNEPRSFRSTNGGLSASYRLPDGFVVGGGIDYEEKQRNTSDIRIVSFREKTEELSYRVDLKRSMSETLNGALAYIKSDRSGSDFQTTTRLRIATVAAGGAVTTVTGANLIAPITLADRERDKVRLALDWQPAEVLALQFALETAHDSYGTRNDPRVGLRGGKAWLQSVDGTYTLSDAWQLTGWASHSATQVDQTTVSGSPADGAALTTQQIWAAALRDRSNSAGLGMRGKVKGKLDVGADIQFSRDRSEYRLATVVQGTSTTSVNSLPDVRYESTTVRLFGRYALQTNAGVQVDLVHDRRTIDDWTWANWVYTAVADGTTVSQTPTQKTNFIGLSGYYKWW